MALSAEVQKRLPEAILVTRVSAPVTAAMLALSRGEPKRAIELLEPVRSYDLAPAAELWPIYIRGQAHLRVKDGAAALKEFQTILDHRGQIPVSLLYPLAHLGAARAATLMGDPRRHARLTTACSSSGSRRTRRWRRSTTHGASGRPSGGIPHRRRPNGPIRGTTCFRRSIATAPGGRWLPAARAAEPYPAADRARANEAVPHPEREGMRMAGAHPRPPIAAQAMRRLLIDHGPSPEARQARRRVSGPEINDLTNARGGRAGACARI